MFVREVSFVWLVRNLDPLFDYKVLVQGLSTGFWVVNSSVNNLRVKLKIEFALIQTGSIRQMLAIFSRVEF